MPPKIPQNIINMLFGTPEDKENKADAQRRDMELEDRNPLGNIAIGGTTGAASATNPLMGLGMLGASALGAGYRNLPPGGQEQLRGAARQVGPALHQLTNPQQPGVGLMPNITNIPENIMKIVMGEHGVISPDPGMTPEEQRQDYEESKLPPTTVVPRTKEEGILADPVFQGKKEDYILQDPVWQGKKEDYIFADPVYQGRKEDYILRAESEDKYKVIPGSEKGTYNLVDKDGNVIDSMKYPNLKRAKDMFKEFIDKGIYKTKPQPTEGKEINTITDVENLITEKAQQYGGRNKFLASDEYKKLYPQIEEIYSKNKSEFTGKAQQALKESGVKVGDKVSRLAQGFGGGEEVSGTVIMKAGVPWVKLDHPQMTNRGYRKQVQWNKGWKTQPKKDVEPLSFLDKLKKEFGPGVAEAEETKQTLGQKNNNPINLKAFEEWEGMTGKDKHGHGIFEDLDYGIRAGLKNLNNHKTKNPDETLKEYMDIFKTKKGDYQAKFIADKMGIKIDTKLKDISMEDMIIPLARIESEMDLTPEQIQAVVDKFFKGKE